MKKEQSKLVLKQAKIPFGICVKLSLKNMWKKKIRFLLLILFCGISLAFLSFTIELNGDILRQNVYTMVENGYQYTEIYQYVQSDSDSLKLDPYNKYSYTELPANSYQKIKENIPEMVVNEYQEVAIEYAGIQLEKANQFYTGKIDTLVRFDETNNYELIAGRKPKNGAKEIIITDYLIEAFHFFDLYPECSTIYDFLNKELALNTYTYRIVGILKTNYEKWTKYATSTQIENDKTAYSYQNDAKMMNSVIVPDPYFSDEQVGYDTSMKISTSQTMGTDRYSWNLTNADGSTYSASSQILTQLDQKIYSFNLWYDTFYLGRVPENDNEIVIPINSISSLYGINKDYRREILEGWDNQINNSKLTLTMKNETTNTEYSKEYTVVGVTSTASTIQFYENDFKAIYDAFNSSKEKVLVTLPKNATQAYNLFVKAYNKGNTNDFSYVLNVWAYRTDIDSYTVDPLINLVAKGGAFVFILFTMGIMWTIVSIDIVDSKKEIGILRSIGLTGFKVSFIFVFQTLLASLASYGIGLVIASKVIPWYNSGIKDSLGVITLYMYNMTYRSYVYLFVFVIVMTLLTTFVPLIKIMSKKIIDVISERE
jgi:hypothetical protein